MTEHVLHYLVTRWYEKIKDKNSEIINYAISVDIVYYLVQRKIDSSELAYYMWSSMARVSNVVRI